MARAYLAAGAAHVAHTAKETNVDTALPGLINTIYKQAVEYGHGADGLTSIIEILKNNHSPHEHI